MQGESEEIGKNVKKPDLKTDSVNKLSLFCFNLYVSEGD